MALAGRTFDGHVMVGTGSWFVDMTDAVNSLSVDGSTNITRQPVMGQRYVDATNQSTTNMVNLSTVYIGPETDALAAQQGLRQTPWVACFDDTVGLAEILRCVLVGMPEDAPTNDAIVTSIDFPQTDFFYFTGKAGSVKRFELAAGTLSVDIGEIGDGEHVFIIVDDTNITAAKTLTVSGSGSEDIEQEVSDEGIWHAGTAGTAHTTSPTISVDALTGQQKINGYVLITKEQGDFE